MAVEPASGVMGIEDSFIRKYWLAIAIFAIAVTGGLYLAYTKTERYDFKHMNPYAYCKQYPEGKYKAEALSRIIYSLHRDIDRWNDDFHFSFYFHGSEKDLAEFARNYSTGEYREYLNDLCEIYYQRLKDKYWNSLNPDNLSTLIGLVEEKYHGDINNKRIWLERQWRNESSAWALVNKDSMYVTDAIDAIYLYLKYHPRGAHALEAYELKEELYTFLQEEEDEED